MVSILAARAERAPSPAGAKPDLEVAALVDPDQRRDLVSPSIIGVAGRNTRDVSYAKQGDHRC